MALFKKGIYQIDDKILNVQSLLIEKIIIQKFPFEKLLIKKIYALNNQPHLISDLIMKRNYFLSSVMNDNSSVIDINLIVDIKVILNKLKIHKKTLYSWMELSENSWMELSENFFLSFRVNGLNDVYLKANNYQNNYQKTSYINIEFIDLYRLYFLLIYYKNQRVFNKKKF